MSEVKHSGSKQPNLKTRCVAYINNHLHVLLSSLGRLYRAPMASAMTIAVMAIALALPTGFYLLLHNVDRLSSGWDSAVRISLYLQPQVDRQQAVELAQRLRLLPAIEQTQVIDKAQALHEFKTLSGFGQALDALDANPLPNVIVITPILDGDNSAETLLAKLSQTPEVEQAQLDLQWLQRFYAILQLVQRASVLIGVMLALAVILIVGNTIRLDIHNRRSEIQVYKLVGATNSFIRRPFLYSGFWYGLLSGTLACVLIYLALLTIQQPIRQLIGLYNSDFTLLSLGVDGSVRLLLCAIALGYIGSWLAVGRHLREIQPG